MAKAKTEEDTRTQRQKFIDTAREHDADGGADAFRSAVRKVAGRVEVAKKAAAAPKRKSKF